MKTITVTIAVLFGLLSSAVAETSATVKTERATSTISSERTGFAPGAATWFVFEQELLDGWHVYWKNPGDSGLPLEISWTLPDGFSAGEIVYPTPERIDIGPLANFGHHGEPVFLVPVTVSEDVPLGQATLGINATWLICEEICVPENGAFELTLPVAASADNFALGTEKIIPALEAAPKTLVGEASFVATPEALVLKVEAPDNFGDEIFFFPEMEGLIEPSAKQDVDVKGGNILISMKPGFAYEPATLETVKGVIATAGKMPIGYYLSATRDESLVVPEATSESAKASISTNNSQGLPLPLLLLAAFFGGVLLNIMPCVFPIIFIKAASLMKSVQSGEAGVVRRDGILYTAGVVATFVLIGGALLAFRASGEQLGWGFHLQSPIVVALSAYVLFLVGLNLAGVFEIGESLQGAGAGLADKGGATGAFFTGALAVVVAAPCIGPLLSAPMGAAVLLPPLWGMLIFILMALGLAAPYLLLCFVPSLGRLLPKPGPWMKVFKQLLSFPVFAAASYFLWVLAQQTGDGLAKALFGAILLAMAAWLFGLSKGDGMKAIAARVVAGLAFVAAILPVTNLQTVTASASVGDKHGALGNVMTYDATELERLRAEGKPVFVDFTAAWCVTCQFNKLTIFSQSSVADAFAAESVAVMVADWTSRDPEITKALEAFGANGVPLYVYYPPNEAATVLSLPLTERSLLDVVAQ